VGGVNVPVFVMLNCEFELFLGFKEWVLSDLLEVKLKR
jgi:hypothetical protein